MTGITTPADGKTYRTRSRRCVIIYKMVPSYTHGENPTYHFRGLINGHEVMWDQLGKTRRITTASLRFSDCDLLEEAVNVEMAVNASAPSPARFSTRKGRVAFVERYSSFAEGRVDGWQVRWDAFGTAQCATQRDATGELKVEDLDLISEIHDSASDAEISASETCGIGQHSPRVTLDQVLALIASTCYFVDGTLTICVLTLKNGFKVTGESVAADPQNMDDRTGRRLARDRAIGNVWPLAIFLLRDYVLRKENPPVVHCRLRVDNRVRIRSDFDESDGAIVTLSTVSDDDKDDGSVPFVSLSMHVRNREALDLFTVDRKFHVDFTLAS